MTSDLTMLNDFRQTELTYNSESWQTSGWWSSEALLMIAQFQLRSSLLKKNKKQQNFKRFQFHGRHNYCKPNFAFGYPQLYNIASLFTTFTVISVKNNEILEQIADINSMYVVCNSM